MDTPTTLKIFNYFNEYSTKNHKVNFTQHSLETSYVLLDRFVRYDNFPGKALRFLQKCVSEALLKKENTLNHLEIISTFSKQSGIPDFLLRDDVMLDDEVLHDFFKERIKGQDHVIHKLASLIKVFKAGLNDPNKPVATLIFAGPTGVGKTATAKAISEYFFGMGQQYRPLIRLDMSEFQHGGQIYRLIGSEGKLVQHVREKPFSVVLLDEIEKANPLIFDALLTVLDEGILLDSAGRMTDFRNTIIIMTSNLGTTQRSSLGFRQYQGQDFEADIKAFFRPEFYNRIDSCLIFNPLDAETIQEITRYELDDIEKRAGIQQRGLKLRFTEALIAHIAEQGFDKKYGARPLQREVERLLVAPLARKLMNDLSLSNQTLTIDFDGEKIVF
jgi:ATP-dependent Clp protease ATP-binding subunit ClpA